MHGHDFTWSVAQELKCGTPTLSRREAVRESTEICAKHLSEKLVFFNTTVVSCQQPAGEAC